MGKKEEWARFAQEIGGEYSEKDHRVYALVDQWRVVVGDSRTWTGSSYSTHSYAWADFLPLDDLEFKLSLKGFFHDFFGRVFGSRDVDVDDLDFQKNYAAESNDREKVNRLLSNASIREIAKRLLVAADFALKRHHGVARLHIDCNFEMKKREQLHLVRTLIADTLKELAAMGSASEEAVPLKWWAPSRVASTCVPTRARTIRGGGKSGTCSGRGLL